MRFTLLLCALFLSMAIQPTLVVSDSITGGVKILAFILIVMDVIELFKK